MIEHDKPLCIIPARGGSKRLPHKNIALLRGKPLLCYAIEAAIESGVFSMICVSSDDDDTLKIAGGYDGVQLIHRSSELSTDKARVVDVCLELLRNFQKDDVHFKEFAVLLATSPLRTSEDIRKAYKIMRGNDVDAVMSIVRFDHTPQTAVWVPDGNVEFFFNKELTSIRQNMPILYRHNGAIYFSKTESFLRNPVQYGEKTVPYYMPPERSVDIDNPIDLEWAEFLLERNKVTVPNENPDSH